MTRRAKVVSISEIRRISDRLGLSLVGHASPQRLSLEQSRLLRWQSEGYGGDLSYMQRNSELLSDPRQLFPDTRSVLMFAVQYSRAKGSPLPLGHGRVARYAWGRDYHRVLKRKLKNFVSEVESVLKVSIQSRAFTDAVPILERAFAAKSGLGFVGKNSMLITPQVGSFSFLGEVLWDVEIEGASLPILDLNCGKCERCIVQCPTKAIVDDYVVDARRCISYLTIEKRGALLPDERLALGEWLFGCDICQEVCPFNHTSMKREFEPELTEFGEGKGVGRSVELAEVLSMDNDESFLRKFSGTPLMRTKREGLIRNAAVVAYNTRSEKDLPFLKRKAVEDSSAVIRQHALWAYVKLSLDGGLGSKSRIRQFVENATKDPEVQVSKEAQDLLAQMNDFE